MGGAVSGLLTSAAEAVGCLACSTCSMMACCGRGKVEPKAAKVFYMFFLGLATLIAVLLDRYGEEWLNDMPSFIPGCHKDDTCFGVQGVFRISFASTVFFAFTLLGSLSATINLGFWGLKFVLFCILIIASFFIDHGIFDAYAKTSRVVSAFYLVLMLIALVDFAYQLHDKLSDKIDEVDNRAGTETGCCGNKWKIIYLVLFAVIWLSAFAGIVAMYATANDPNNSCATAKWFISLTLITGLAYTVMSPMTWTTGGGRGVLPPAIVFMYCVWLCWSAITSSATEQCNPLPASNTTTSVLAGIAVATVSVMYTSHSASRSIPMLFSSPPPPSAQAEGHLLSDSNRQEADVDSDEEMGRAKEAPRPIGAPEQSSGGSQDAAPKDLDYAWAFHLVMLLSSMFMCMVLTNWATQMDGAASTRHSDSTMWIKIGSQWVTIALYMWTLMAQKCCPGRDFS